MQSRKISSNSPLNANYNKYIHRHVQIVRRSPHRRHKKVQIMKRTFASGAFKTESCARRRCSERRRFGVYTPGRRPRAMRRSAPSAERPTRAPPHPSTRRAARTPRARNVGAKSKRAPTAAERKGSWRLGAAPGRRQGSAVERRALETASTTASTSAPSWKDEPAIGALELDEAHLPRHVAVIMDGNGRWATERGVAVAEGHERGVDTLRTIVRCAGAWDLSALTVYAFSHENWRRSRNEVDHLMNLLERTLVAELPSLVEEGVKVTVMGDMGMIDDGLRAAITNAVDATAANTKLRLNVALAYGARQDIVAAARMLATEAAGGLLDPEDITEDLLGEHLASRTLPADLREPDLLVRPGGER